MNKAQGHQVQKVSKEVSQATCVDKDNKQKKYRDTDSLLWHARLGHGSISKLAHIPCISKYMNEEDFSCEACIIAKFHRQRNLFH